MNIKGILETMEYGPAPESRSDVDQWLANHSSGFQLYIDGNWVNASGNRQFAVHHPASGEKLADVAEAHADDVHAAVSAAKRALKPWLELGCHGRARYLYAIARHIQKKSRFFAVLEALDNGKPIRETRDIDIPLVARHFYHHAGWAQVMDEELPDFQPVGVVGQVIPWNFPLLMMAWKIAPALAMGNTVVLKPAEFTPLTAIAFAELCQAVGLPKGVVNIITGAGETGAALVEHPDVNKVAFTGSTEVGRIIRRAIAGSGKKLSLELGGKSPFIVFDDADLDSVVEGVVDAIWFNQGQVCCAGSRLLVQENVADPLIAKLKARMELLRVGNPLDKAVDIGAIVDPVQLARIRELVDQGVAEGAELFQPSSSCPSDGCFFPPSLFTNVAPSSTIAEVEIFGPVLVSMTFRTPSEAVKLANNTRYGLAASIWTENINLALDIAPKVKAGTIWINCTNTFDAASGFGGYRESGFGREGGLEGLWEYVKEKPRPAAKPIKTIAKPKATKPVGLPTIDRTAKLYIGGKQVRPDGGNSLEVHNPWGDLVGEVARGNRKDIRNAVEKGHSAESWTKAPAHNRAQVMYFIAENLEARSCEFALNLAQLQGISESDANREVHTSIQRVFSYAAMADKYDSRVHHTPMRSVTLAMNEAVGLLGIVCPDQHPLLAFVSTVMPAIAMGNRVIVLPSEKYPLAVTDFYQVLETSDLPGGVVNIVTGPRNELTQVLANHDDVDGMWYFGPIDLVKDVEYAAAENMKRTWCVDGSTIDWYAGHRLQTFLRHAVEIKNIWVPYGE